MPTYFALSHLRSRKSELSAIAAKRGARDLRVFGSVARGEDGPDSDIDLLVHMDAGRSLLDLVGLQQDLSEALGKSVDVISDRGIYPYLRDRILNEAIPL